MPRHQVGKQKDSPTDHSAGLSGDQRFLGCHCLVWRHQEKCHDQKWPADGIYFQDRGRSHPGELRVRVCVILVDRRRTTEMRCNKKSPGAASTPGTSGKSGEKPRGECFKRVPPARPNTAESWRRKQQGQEEGVVFFGRS